MIAEMEQAERFIFLCYFILDTGKLWDRVSDVLVRKAREGVEVRLMYDDLGSIATVPDHLLRDLRAKGIQRFTTFSAKASLTIPSFTGSLILPALSERLPVKPCLSV